MPVTKTAKRALRVSQKKAIVNRETERRLDIALHKAKKTKSVSDINTASSLTDRSAKKHLIHKNKAARIKSQLSKLAAKKPDTKAAAKTKKSSSKKPKTAKK